MAYLDPVAPVASDALLTDDPKAAMELAVALAGTPRMSNLAHGLWGYHGVADGLELTVQSLGIGGPSAAAVLAELAAHGTERAIRIGSCNALDPKLKTGDVVIPTVVEPRDGLGSATARGRAIEPDGAFLEALERATGMAGSPIRSVDLHEPDSGGRPSQRGVAVAADLSSAALLASGVRLGVRIACALVVARSAEAEELGRDALEQALLALGLHAADALARAPQLS